MLTAKHFRSHARAALKGQWMHAGGAALVAGFLGAVIMQEGPKLSFEFRSDDASLVEKFSSIFRMEQVAIFLLLVMATGFTVFIWLLLKLIIGGAATLGYAKFNLKLVDGENPKVRDVLSQFHRMGTGFWMQFLRALFVTLWSILFIIPGYIASYSYAMTPYILVENPEMTVRDAIKESKRLMNGNKWRLFCLNFSFLGWELVAVMLMTLGLLSVVVWIILGGAFVTVFLGMAALIVIFISYQIISTMVLVPYVEAARAVFYREIKEQRYSQRFFDFSSEEF